MNAIEHLITCAGEEAAEIGQAVGKMLRFGVLDTPPRGGLCNADYFVLEVNDLLAVIEMLQERGVPLTGIGDRQAIQAKKDKLLKMMDYARGRGTLSSIVPAAPGFVPAQ